MREVEHHGHTPLGPDGRQQRSPEYNIYRAMLNRCFREKDPRYADYGGRGITVCDRWRKSFLAFMADMGPRPSASLTLDRFPNNDGNYEPGNVRWATRTEQCRNQRSNRLLTLNGRTLTLVEWAAETGLQRQTIARRIQLGWSVDAALTQPVGKSS